MLRRTCLVSVVRCRSRCLEALEAMHNYARTGGVMHRRRGLTLPSGPNPRWRMHLGGFGLLNIIQYYAQYDA